MVVGDGVAATGFGVMAESVASPAAEVVVGDAGAGDVAAGVCVSAGVADGEAGFVADAPGADAGAELVEPPDDGVAPLESGASDGVAAAGLLLLEPSHPKF